MVDSINEMIDEQECLGAGQSLLLPSKFSLKKVGDYSELTSLSYRERQVFINIALGMSYKDIAWQMKVSENTIKTYVQRIRGKNCEISKDFIRASILNRTDIYPLFKPYIL